MKSRFVEVDSLRDGAARSARVLAHSSRGALALLSTDSFALTPLQWTCLALLAMACLLMAARALLLKRSASRVAYMFDSELRELRKRV